MLIQNARKILRGEKEFKGTLGEGLQLMMGACLTDEGGIICLTCNLPNECCECGRTEEVYD